MITQWAKSPKKQSVGVYILSAELKKTHSFRLVFFLRFCPLDNFTINLFAPMLN